MGSGSSCNQGLAACLPSPKPVLEYKVNSNLEAFTWLNTAAKCVKSTFFSFNFKTVDVE